MPGYRHYRLDGAGKITKAEWLEAESDEEATAIVRDRKLSVTSEIWNGDRLVSRIEASSRE